MRFPSLSTGAVLTVAFLAVVVLVRTTLPLIDGDVWWHLRAGETVLDTGTVPVVDTWTIVGEGMAWTSQDWLSNVVMAVVLSAGSDLGPTLLSLLFGLIAVAAFGVLWWAVGVRAPTASSVGRVAFLTLGLIVAAPILGVRVQTVDVLLIALTIALLWWYLRRRSLGPLVLLPVLAAAWANLHAAWPLLFALAGAVVIGEVADATLGRRVDSPPLTLGESGRLVAATVVSGVALLLNPNGARLLAYPFATAGIDAHRDFIFEWSSPDLTTFAGQAVLAFLGFVVAPTVVLGVRRLRAAEILWLVGLSVLALGAIRFAIAIGPVGAALAAVALGPRLAAVPALRGAASALARMDIRPRRAGPRAVNAVLALVLAALGVGVALARVAPEEQRIAIADAMPTRATEWLRENRPASRIFNVYAWGGYVGRELPASRVYIDGRSDIYGDEPIREYAEAIALERDPFAILDRNAVDVVLFWPDTGLAEALDRRPEWDRAYTDDQAAIWVRADRP